MAELPPNVTLAQLAYFVAVAEELHFSRAAKRLHISQSPLSQAIRALESNLGVELLQRTSRRVELTPAGEELLPAARATLAAARQAVNVAQGAAAAETGTVRVGFLAYGACNVIDLSLGAFAAESSKLRVQTSQSDFSDPTAGLADGAVDAAFVRLPISAPELETRTLMSEPRVAMLPNSHPLAGRERVEIAELLGERWLQMPAGDGVWRDFWLAREHRGGAEPLLGPEVRTIEEQLAATTAGGCVSLTPESIAAFYPRPGVSYVPVSGVAPSQIAVAWRRGDERPTVEAFLATVEEAAASLEGSAPELSAAAR
ncbi:MAG: LysR family transcriptional regulator [Actinobacteria bacterium]|nr:LysR family transcriptional regulator [Actinomycetota bacterium]